VLLELRTVIILDITGGDINIICCLVAIVSHLIDVLPLLLSVLFLKALDVLPCVLVEIEI
jgi:hypothetical protein